MRGGRVVNGSISLFGGGFLWSTRRRMPEIPCLRGVPTEIRHKSGVLRFTTVPRIPGDLYIIHLALWKWRGRIRNAGLAMRSSLARLTSSFLKIFRCRPRDLITGPPRPGTSVLFPQVDPRQLVLTFAYDGPDRSGLDKRRDRGVRSLGTIVPGVGTPILRDTSFEDLSPNKPDPYKNDLGKEGDPRRYKTTTAHDNLVRFGN